MHTPEGPAQLLRDLVHEYTGSYFDASRLDTLLEKLEPLARERRCRSFLDYYYLLKFDGETVGEWARVMDALSVQETYFWREIDQVRALVDVLVPAWFAQKRGPLRIWSAACATGEEPFTISMALNEAGWLDRAPIEIVASDASVTALEKARRGIFRERSFRSLPDDLRAKYFRSVPLGWCIAPEMLVHVRFQRANLVAAGEIDALASSPIIFCRNVFIYFSPAAITRTAASGPILEDLMIQAQEQIESLTGVRAVFYVPRLVQTWFRRQLVANKGSYLTQDDYGGQKVMSFNGTPIRRTDALNVNEAQVV